MRARLLVPVLAVLAIVAGVLLVLTGHRELAHSFWMIAAIATGAPVVFKTLRSATRGQFATDVVATLSIVGSVALSQPLAGLVIVVMQTGGEALERYAEGRASAAVRALEEAAPRRAHRVVDHRIEEIAATDVAVGDELMIRPGDLIPCDGVILDGESELDTSSLTGEAAPVPGTPGVAVMSGTANGFGALRMRATAIAERSQYARIVELVRTAQSSKAPLQRLADRYAVWFTPLTIIACAIVVAVTHDWMRALAVLVVATPCPLILATPVAIIGGINRAANRHIIMRHGGAREQLSAAATVVFDKTGTITIGKPQLKRVNVARDLDPDVVLRYAAAIEQGSSHLLGRVLVEVAEAAGMRLPPATSSQEAPGQGVFGVVEGHAIRVGGHSFVEPHCDRASVDAFPVVSSESTLRAYVEIDGRLAAIIEFADEIRPELPRLLESLRKRGLRRPILLSGDHASVTRAFGDAAGIQEVYGDLLPADKAQFVTDLRAKGNAVMMIGDGINDAPALTAANVGVALAGHGAGITAEAADVILLVDSLDRVSDAVDIASRTMRIARQSIRVGLGLSVVAMGVAAFGALPPVAGAVLQEAIDVAVILNALRSAREPRSTLPRTEGSMKRILLGLFILLHACAHANVGVWAFADGPVWLVTALWGIAMLGYFAAGFGILRVPFLRDRWKQAMVAATIASVLLLLLFVHGIALVGVVIDVAVLILALEWELRLIDADVAVVDALGAEGIGHPLLHRIGWTISVLILAYATAVVAVRPLYVRWGTTPAERAGRLPGDELAPDARYRVDHAITIHAPASAVWPWLAQLGQDRGGFYSYDWLERLIGDRIHNADRIHPEWQKIEAGDLVRATQPDYLGGRFGDIGWRVVDVVPGQALILENWGAFVVQPVDSMTSRFIVRTRGPGTPSLAGIVLGPLNVFVFEPAHFIMQRGMLRGVRDRAERLWASQALARR